MDASMEYARDLYYLIEEYQIPCAPEDKKNFQVKSSFSPS